MREFILNPQDVATLLILQQAVNDLLLYGEIPDDIQGELLLLEPMLGSMIDNLKEKAFISSARQSKDIKAI